MTCLCLEILKGKVEICDLNKTFIVLILKVKNATKVTEFRPISLYNVIYKIITKTIANRLKLILPSVISESQIPFVPNQLISNNSIVAFELMHSL